MLSAARRWFSPAPELPIVGDPNEVARRYVRWRWSVFLSITIGYAFFYTTRLSTSVTKDSLIRSGILSAAETGLIDFIFLISYAISKTANGFIADRVNPRPFFATALLLSALVNVTFGLSGSFALFAVLWALNGWCQSAGVPTSGVVLAAWFSRREIGTRYSAWSLSHNIGEGLTFLITARLVAAAGAGSAQPWRIGFIGPGLVCILVALVLYRTMSDRPRSLGLPSVAEFTGTPAPVHQVDHSSPSQDPAAPAHDPAETWKAQIAVLRNPWVWVCGLASAMMYVSRYAINNWGIFYLQHEKGYSLEDAGAALSLFPVVGMAGGLLAGTISDRLAGARRVPVSLGYGTLLLVSLAVLYLVPGDNPWLVRVSLGAAGFGIGGQLIFLGGLIALDICSERAAGAALGVVGGFSYLGAGLQSIVSGILIERHHSVVNGQHIYEFTTAKYVWLGAAAVSLALTGALWNAERRKVPVPAPN